MNATLEKVDSETPDLVDDEPSGRSSRWSLYLGRTIILVCVLAVWEYAGRNWIDPFWISSPSEIGERLLEWARSGSLAVHVPYTLGETLAGFAIGTLAGGVAGFLLGWYRRLAELLDPFIIALYSLPKVALAPLFILWFGIGLQSKIVLTAVIVFFLVLFNAYAGVRNASRELIDIVRLMGASSAGVMWRVVLPSALTMIFLGLRISVPYALIGAVVGEMMASNRGIGFLIVQATGQFDTAGAFAAFAILIVLATILNGLVQWVERYVLRWKAYEQ
ncbi:MAG: ABC transporter permease [Burkholderiaceae bacterium]